MAARSFGDAALVLLAQRVCLVLIVPARQTRGRGTSPAISNILPCFLFFSPLIGTLKYGRSCVAREEGGKKKKKGEREMTGNTHGAEGRHSARLECRSRELSCVGKFAG